VAALFMEEMRYLKKEYFRVLLLNVKNEIITVEDVSIGSISSSDAHPREVLQCGETGCGQCDPGAQSSERQS
jgi:DNA repair protein RadC